MISRPERGRRLALRFRYIGLASVVCGLAVLLVGMNWTTAEAAAPPPSDAPPFRLPFLEPPGPDTWLFEQPYGNTEFAYDYRSEIYWAGQGFHFGVDFIAPCGTPIVAIGDGVVHSIDGPHGARPHNLMIDHPNGYASFYGHLLVRPALSRGEAVQAGQVVGYVGDPDLTCASRPHLHLEIRASEDYATAYNPILLIDANWDMLLMMGGLSVAFEQDQNNMRQWQSIYDQPLVRFGYPILNNYQEPWPYDW